MKRLLLRESQVQPLILVFEDLHWIDAETEALLDSSVESLPTAQILLLVDYRLDYQHSWSRKTYYTQLRLDPLPRASADSLLQALLGDDAGLVPLRRLLIAHTLGNPFFLGESVRTLVETGVLVGARGVSHLAQPPETLSANKFICHVRFKRSGAWWYVTNANQLLALRCAEYNGSFDRIFARYRQRLQDRSG